MIKNILCLFALIILISCEKDKVQKDLQPKKETPIPTVSFRTALIDEELSTKLNIGKVYLGDLIRFKIEGKIIYDQFPKKQTKQVNSTWKKKICLPSGFPHNFPDLCHTIPMTGKCSILRQPIPVKTISDISFTNNLEELRVILKIGDYQYQFDKVIENGNNYIIADLKITEKMTNDFSEAYLQVIPITKTKKTRVGFLKYLQCDGISKRSFKVNTDTSHRIIESKYTETYNINTWVKYGN